MINRRALTRTLFASLALMGATMTAYAD